MVEQLLRISTAIVIAGAEEEYALSHCVANIDPEWLSNVDQTFLPIRDFA
jgi:hypothetical protein